jgi:methyltransferase (TIGR00027 family)
MRLSEGKPSTTAHGAAEGRAAHQLLDRPIVFEDAFALKILGPEGEAKLRAELAEQQTPLMRGLRGQFVGRGRFAEDRLADATGRGTRQYIVLGAGLDTYAYRYPDAGFRVFEVDHPATQAWKRDRLAEAGMPLPKSLLLVPVDFETDKLRDELAAAGFDERMPAFVACLGVSYYLEKQVLHDTLRWAASLCPGSEIVLDFMPPPSPQQAADARAMMEKVAAKVAAQGEPLRSYFQPEEFTDAATNLGLKVDIVTAAQINATYFESVASDLRMRGYMLHARV